MNDLTKENPKASKRSKRRPAMEPLGWDEIVSQPGMGGYLSFLNGPVPLPHLQASDPDLIGIPGVVTTAGIDLGIAVDSLTDGDMTPAIDNTPGTHSSKHVSSSRVATTPAYVSDPEAVSTAEVISTDSHPVSHLTPGVPSRSGHGSAPGISPAPRIRIRRCLSTRDGHSLGEEVLYQAIWNASRPETVDSRTIVIGWRGMSQLCRLTPKNCKINTQRLIRKLALEVLSPYNTPESIGTTYRVYSDQAILRRRHDAGLEWVVRSRGVDFVDPATGVSILPICAHTHQAHTSQI